MQRKDGKTPRTTSRAGFLAPAIVVALLCVMLVLALVIDRLWLQNTSVEMDAAVESAALASARSLITDDLLRANYDGDKTADRAKQNAIDIANQNRVAGNAMAINDGDIRIGRYVRNQRTGRVRFVESNARPNAVIVTGRRSRNNGNPIALFVRGLSGHSTADVIRDVEVRIDNRVVGIRPFAGVNAPLWPFAILESSKSEVVATWQTQIDRRGGTDQYGYNEKFRRVTAGADGIPEITLYCPPPNGTEEQQSQRNVCLLDLGSNLQRDAIARQIDSGISADDLKMAPDGTLRFDGQPLNFGSYDDIPRSLRGPMRQQIGRCRMVMLYAPSGQSRVSCRRLVGGRIMAVKSTPDGGCHIVFQPGTLTTRTAVLADGTYSSDVRDQFANPYIYKLQLTR